MIDHIYSFHRVFQEAPARELVNFIDPAASLDNLLWFRWTLEAISSRRLRSALVPLSRLVVESDNPEVAEECADLIGQLAAGAANRSASRAVDALMSRLSQMGPGLGAEWDMAYINVMESLSELDPLDGVECSAANVRFLTDTGIRKIKMIAPYSPALSAVYACAIQ